jgi:hypothetical protein
LIVLIFDTHPMELSTRTGLRPGVQPERRFAGAWRF